MFGTWGTRLYKGITYPEVFGVPVPKEITTPEKNVGKRLPSRHKITILLHIPLNSRVPRIETSAPLVYPTTTPRSSDYHRCLERRVVRLNETEKILVLGSPKAEILGNVFGGQGQALVNFLDADRGRKHRKEIANDDRDVHGPMPSARIGDLMWCTVVMQVDDRPRSEIKGYDRVYCLKANITESLDKSDLLYF
ncbi:hypothetical protein B0H13DRAFT_1875556 [Mycena leptocephala]|nr:hypothetical protein B0H13DRAFT_1875556 [Mycena leptocephala]